MDIKSMSDRVYSGADREKKEKMDKVYYDIAEHLKQHDMEGYKKFCEMAEDIVYDIDEDRAHKIVSAMKPYGQQWNMDEITEFIATKGIMDKAKCYYLVMNMAYNDYMRTAQKHGVDNADFFFDLAYDFINDPDAKKHKVEKYFMD